MHKIIAEIVCSAISSGRRSYISVIKDDEKKIAAQSKVPSTHDGGPGTGLESTKEPYYYADNINMGRPHVGCI